MKLNNLFALRGDLDKKSSLLLSIIGVLFILGVWYIGAEYLSNTVITQVDYGVDLSSIKDRKYYDNDSVLVANYSFLEKMSNEDLAHYGLERKKVHSLLPSPKDVLLSFAELNKQDDLIGNTFFSIRLNLLGYFIAILISIPIGFLLGLLPLFRGLFSKIIDAYRFIPLTAVTGIFIMWLGLGSEMKVSFLAFGIIVYLIPVVVQRIDEVESVYLRTVFTLGASSWQTIKTVYIPHVFSKIIDDVRVLTAISWTYITIAEMLNKGGGIGELIWIAKRQSRIDKAFAVLLVIVVIGILQDRLFVFLDKILFPHKHINKGKKH